MMRCHAAVRSSMRRSQVNSTCPVTMVTSPRLCTESRNDRAGAQIIYQDSSVVLASMANHSDHCELIMLVDRSCVELFM
jgi:hypothetical protein